MTKITEFIGGGKKTLEGDIVNRFTKLIEGKSKEEVREIELSLLKPKPIAHYKGKRPSKLTDLNRRRVTIYFQNEKVLMRFSRFLKVQTYIENNIHEVGLLLEMLRLLESETLRWNEKGGHFLTKTGKITRRMK